MGVIEREPILSEKKHLTAIIQLLGRLSGVETDAKEEKHVEPPACPQVGDKVVLVGLRDSEHDQNLRYNGELGEIVKARPHKDKYEVSIRSHGIHLPVKGR